jgi:hypothetical protein
MLVSRSLHPAILLPQQTHAALRGVVNQLCLVINAGLFVSFHIVRKEGEFSFDRNFHHRIPQIIRLFQPAYKGERRLAEAEPHEASFRYDDTF